MASERLVTKLNLVTKPHPKPYKLQWLSEVGEVLVKKQVEVEFSIGKYQDKVLCDVVPMEASHLLLGRPWQFDKRANHDGYTNKISFIHQDKKMVLKPLSPQEVFEDQKKLRKKILQEREQKENESQTLESSKRVVQKVSATLEGKKMCGTLEKAMSETLKSETLERQKCDSPMRKQEGIAQEKEGKKMILTNQPLKLLNCGNQNFSANHFVNLKLFSSVKFFLQDFKEEQMKMFVQGRFIFDPGGLLDLRTNLFQEGGSDEDMTKAKDQKECGNEDNIKGKVKGPSEGQGYPKIWAKARAILQLVLMAIVKVRPKLQKPNWANCIMAQEEKNGAAAAAL